MARYAFRLRRTEIERTVRAPKPRSVVPKLAPPDYSTFLKADLVAAADARGLDSSGTKADILERLVRHG